MDDLLFDQLQESITEAGAIHKGNAAPSREFRFDNPDVKAIRENTGLSQSKFAYLIGVSLKTLQNWEQGKRDPQGPSRALLTIFSSQPNMAIAALRERNAHPMCPNR
ncbi:MAG: helix-turn-helix domain-containing protein [Magnetococcales bacterium]|nr:helix-turn-helix domain-containing protein [Magnetococcales bacterium]